MNASMKKERVIKASEETMVESLYLARQETFYCGLILQKHAKTMKYRACNQPGRIELENEPTSLGAQGKK